ncbi:MAG: hypothetical protein HN768_06625, partial [Rhodospirillaceae bacterium]|nr:hypothetical protein [Rhodospirillaceae bacterium]
MTVSIRNSCFVATMLAFAGLANHGVLAQTDDGNQPLIIIPLGDTDTIDAVDGS